MIQRRLIFFFFVVQVITLVPFVRVNEASKHNGRVIAILNITKLLPTSTVMVYSHGYKSSLPWKIVNLAIVIVFPKLGEELVASF